MQAGSVVILAQQLTVATPQKLSVCKTPPTTRLTQTFSSVLQTHRIFVPSPAVAFAGIAAALTAGY
ncbi:MAG: hypothetical protein ACRC46_12075 [Thermoguttaceae bacterium]